MTQQQQPPTVELKGTQFHHAAALDAHSQKALLTPAAKYTDALSNSRAHNLPDITITALQGQELAIHCQLIKAQNILEIGTLGGYSTLWFASTGAHVTSIEIDPKHRSVALENTRAHGDNVEIILGAALDVMPKLIAEGRVFDFVFIDADWGEQWECFDLAVQMTRTGGCVYVDNVVRELLESGVIYGQGKDGKNGKESLLTKVGRDKRVTATLIPTVGSHKAPQDMFDGHVLAIVKEGK